MKADITSIKGEQAEQRGQQKQRAWMLGLAMLLIGLGTVAVQVVGLARREAQAATPHVQAIVDALRAEIRKGGPTP
jgi:hypothetical protein